MNTLVILFFGRKSTKTEEEVFSGKVTILARVIVAEKNYTRRNWLGGRGK